MIEFKNLSAGYGSKIILKDINTVIGEGKITGIIGANGCGKSTLMKSALNLADIMEGEIYINKFPKTNLSSLEIAKKIAYLPQSKDIPEISVSSLVLHGRFPHLEYPRRYRKNDFSIAEEAIKTLGITDIKDQRMAELSGGQRKKAYIAMALAQQTPVIFMDEPTTYLDISYQLKLTEIIKALKASGKTILIVLHDLTLAYNLCDNLIVMKNGKITFQGTPREVIENGSAEDAFDIKFKKISHRNETIILPCL